MSWIRSLVRRTKSKLRMMNTRLDDLMKAEAESSSSFPDMKSIHLSRTALANEATVKNDHEIRIPNPLHRARGLLRILPQKLRRSITMLEDISSSCPSKLLTSRINTSPAGASHPQRARKQRHKYHQSLVSSSRLVRQHIVAVSQAFSSSQAGKDRESHTSHLAHEDCMTASRKKKKNALFLMVLAIHARPHMQASRGAESRRESDQREVRRLVQS